jgi:hypothetical protein
MQASFVDPPDHSGTPLFHATTEVGHSGEGNTFANLEAEPGLNHDGGGGIRLDDASAVDRPLLPDVDSLGFCWDTASAHR